MKAKKVMALMLCAAMVTSMSATAAFAAEEKEDAATEESADSTAAEDPTAQFDGLKANEAYEFPMITCPSASLTTSLMLLYIFSAATAPACALSVQTSHTTDPSGASAIPVDRKSVV